MARLFQAPFLYLIALLIIQSVLLSFVEGQANSTFVEQFRYTTFELFKNTGLRPCPINDTISEMSIIVPKDPGQSGGGSSGGDATDELIKSTWVGNQGNYCKYMKGTPVMIPTIPTQNAFTPWWPAFTTQFVSLLVTWIGLWWTSRSIDKNPEARDMSLPITFWMQLPIDICRIIAWFVKTIHGFADARRFAWVSVILWLVPFNYIWLVQLLGSKKDPVRIIGRQDATWTNQVKQPMEHTFPRQEAPKMQEPEVQHSDRPRMAECGSSRSRSKYYWISVTFGVITIIQWCMSLAVVALHFRYSWMDRLSHPTYVEAFNAVNNPSSIAIMPQACLNWLQQSADLIASELLDIHVVQVVQTLIVALQFIMCTVVVLFRGGGRHHILGKLKISALASLVTLGLPAIGTGFWILGTVVFGNQDTWLTYTHNVTTTGGCTFGAVAMNRQWGYWDVQYERPYRIAMSVLGVA